MKQTIEIMRHNVTPAQFLAYVRAQLKKKGMRDISSDLDLAYFVRGNDLNFDYHDEPGRPCKAEKGVSHPYEMQTYVLNWDGSCYNEICEFEFDDEKTGHGYYYLCNVTVEVEEQPVEAEQMKEEKNMYNDIVKTIVRKYGGYREKDILKNPHTIERGSSWNNEHKVLEILSTQEEPDGYRNGFQVDLVTMSICG